MSSQAVEMKDQGNQMYGCRRYDEAIKCYTKAIQLGPQTPTFFTNRALCHLKMNQWASAQMDCRSALELDHSLVKGHFFYGQALLGQGLCEEAFRSLQRAYELAKDQKLHFGDDITSALRLAKKRIFLQQEEKRVAQEIELQSYLNRLCAEDRDGLAERIRHEGQQAGLGEDEIQAEIAKVARQHDERLSTLNGMFAQVDERRRTRDVPDYLCGKISFELMQDPVITPSGITYDRKDIEEHLQRVGHFDPVTRADLTQPQLTPNLAMKDVIDLFLQENAWAEEGY